MKKTKKLLVFGLVAIGTLGLAISCDETGEGGGGSTTYDLVYRSWDTGTTTQNNEERQLVKMFEDEHNVRIKIVESPGSGDAYWTNIRASVSNGIDLADVFMLPNIDWPLADQYLLDLTEYTSVDSEYALVPSSVRDACSFKSGTYALPARLNMQGYFVNTRVAEDLGVESSTLTCESSYSVITDLVDKAHANANYVGLDSAAHFIDIMGNVNSNGEYGYFTWDGEQYHLDSDAFVTGVQAAKAMFEAGKTLDSYDDAKKEALGLDLTVDAKVDAWNKGKLALRYGYTYEVADMLTSNNLGNSYKFIGNPGGDITIIGDYYGIYKETKNPDLAYEFAKWMSFGKAGYAARLEAYKEKGSVNSLPLINDEELINQYFETYGDNQYMSGIEDAYEYMQENSMVEGVKVVPGYLSARQNKKTGITVGEIQNASMFELLNACVVGGANIADYTTGTTNIDTIADQTYTDWMNTNGSKYN